MAKLPHLDARSRDHPGSASGWRWPLILLACVGGMLLLGLYGWYVAGRIARAWCFGC